jgi:hypothetical protein
MTQKHTSKFNFKFLCLLLSCSAFFFSQAEIQANNTNNESIDRIVEFATAKKSLEYQDIFKDKFGENLYLKIYQDAGKNKFDNSFKEIASAKGYTQEELSKFQNNDLSGFFAKNPRLSIDQAIAKIQDLQSEIAENQYLQDIKKELLSEVESSEIFSNNSVLDSGFDLITDLNLIEEILFGTVTKGQIGGNQLMNPKPQTQNQNPSNTSASRTTDQVPNTSTQTPTTNSANGTKNAEEIKKIKPEEFINPCPIENEIQKAIKSHQSEIQNKSTGADLSSNLESLSQEITNNPDSAAEISNRIQAANSEAWIPDPFCEDTICLEIRARMSMALPAPRSAKKDDCILCHIKAINKSLNDLLSKSLIPGKVSGAVGEPGLCKAGVQHSFTAVSMKIIAIPKPVPVQGAARTYNSRSISGEWNKLLGNSEKTPTPSNSVDTFIKQNKDTEELLKKLTITDPQAQIQLNEINKRVLENVARLETERAQNLKNLETQNRIENANTYFQSVRNELLTMNSYFLSFKNIFNQLSENCAKLSTKKECS